MIDRNTSVASVLADVRAEVATLFSRARRTWRLGTADAFEALTRFHDPRSPLLDQVVAQPNSRQAMLLSGTTLTLLGVLLTGFMADVAFISPLRYAREQIVQSEAFRATLANGEGPVGQVDQEGNAYPLGTPVATMYIPAIGLNAVVDEGTTSRTLLSAPGHRRDTVLPGQAGASVIYGRQSLYGAPFGSLNQLKAGNTIRFQTGQGKALYRISGIRYGDTTPLAPSTAPGTLTLVSTTGIPFFPTMVVRVDASLISWPKETPLPVIYAASLPVQEKLLATDDSGWLPLLLLIELGIALVALAAVGIKRWGRLHTWVVATPTLFAVGVAIAEEVVVLLPNLY